VISITRGGSYDVADVLKLYKIYIDGEHRGKIKINETVEFPVENGRREVLAKIDWRRSDREDNCYRVT